MNEQDNPVFEFARKHNIDLLGDIDSSPLLVPSFEVLDDIGSIWQHVTDTGASYIFYKINYSDENGAIQSTRTIAVIPAGERTELAYFTQGAGTMVLDVHRGRGNLVIGYPDTGTTTSLPFDSKNVTQVILPAGCFYTIQADQAEHVVISGFYEHEPDGTEISLQPGQDTVNVPEGIIHVPSDFMAAVV